MSLEGEKRVGGVRRGGGSGGAKRRKGGGGTVGQWSRYSGRGPDTTDHPSRADDI